LHTTHITLSFALLRLAYRLFIIKRNTNVASMPIMAKNVAQQAAC